MVNVYFNKDTTDKVTQGIRDAAQTTAEQTGTMTQTATDDRFVQAQKRQAEKAVKVSERAIQTVDAVDKYTAASVQQSEDMVAEIMTVDERTTGPVTALRAVTDTSGYSSEKSSSTTGGSFGGSSAESASVRGTTSESFSGNTDAQESESSLNSTEHSTRYAPYSGLSQHSSGGVSADQTPGSGSTQSSTSSAEGSAMGDTRTYPTPDYNESPRSTSETTTASEARTPSTAQRSDITIPTQASPRVEYTPAEVAKAEQAVTNPRSAGSTFSEIVNTFKPIMQDVYPAIRDTANVISEQRAVMFEEQARGEGSKQPAGTVRLTQDQAEKLAEAIAHNINVQRQAEVDAINAANVAGAAPGAGAGQGTFAAGGISPQLTPGADNYHQNVLSVAQQLVSAQPPIPYAWGGGHGASPGPSQGTTGNAYADACGDYNKIGLDCSGLSRYVTALTMGVDINGTAATQCSMCQLVQQPMIGDLGFPNASGPGHVVVYVGGGQVVEAQQSGTFMMFSPAQAGYVWGRLPNSPNWQLEASGQAGYAY